jgi:hypothetical protein
MRNVMLLVIVLGLFGASCGDGGSSDPGSCGDFNERICAKAAQCAGSSGEFGVRVGLEGSANYSSESECNQDETLTEVMLDESVCNQASESEIQACDQQIQMSQCAAMDNELYVDTECGFSGR